MCKYCEGTSDLAGDKYNHMWIQGTQIEFLSTEGDDDYRLTVDAKFCPMCGRPLGGDVSSLWSDVSKVPPPQETQIMFTDGDGYYAIGDYWKTFDGEDYWQGRGEPRCSHVTHWMFVPQLKKDK